MRRKTLTAITIIVFTALLSGNVHADATAEKLYQDGLDSLAAATDPSADRAALDSMWNAILLMDKSDGPTALQWLLGNEKELGFADRVAERLVKAPVEEEYIKELRSYLDKAVEHFQPDSEKAAYQAARLKNLKVDLAFDEPVRVGMLRFQAARHDVAYDRTDATRSRFDKALPLYEQAYQAATTPYARALLACDFATLSSRFKKKDRPLLVEVYRNGFWRAREGIARFGQVPEDNKDEALSLELNKAYGANLMGTIYNLFLLKRHKEVFDHRKFLEIDFKRSYRVDCFLLTAESARILAMDKKLDNAKRSMYANVSVEHGKKAFDLIVENLGGKPPTEYNKDFCKVFNAYWNYLDAFGFEKKAKELERLHGPICPAKGGPPKE
jgi:hypothetical protein